VEVPVLVGALGPKGHAVAKKHGDGLYVTLQLPEFMSEYEWVPYLAWGTVLDDGEPLDSPHARLAGGPGWALAYHGAYEFGGPAAVEALPGGAEWLAVVNRTPEADRHLSVHSGHCVALSEADQAAWDAGGHTMLKDVTLTGTHTEVRAKLDELAARGVTEIVFQPCGPNTKQELERFQKAAS
jgi:alkanesulfonate monooxygenase SsuD/methylene tetrahydromethanopterin reductase-like flavin-dependent oxidoreductase (luciferase family)